MKEDRSIALGKVRFYGVVAQAVADSVIAEDKVRRDRIRQHLAAAAGLLVIGHVFFDSFSAGLALL